MKKLSLVTLSDLPKTELFSGGGGIQLPFQVLVGGPWTKKKFGKHCSRARGPTTDLAAADFRRDNSPCPRCLKRKRPDMTTFEMLVIYDLQGYEKI